MESLLRREQFEYLISAGFAGALEKELRVGHLLIAENFSSPQLLRSAPLDLADDGVFLGKLLTVSSVIDSTAEREQFAAKTGAAAVDMETEFIAEACADYQLPLFSLRAISDTPSEPFPRSGACSVRSREAKDGFRPPGVLPGDASQRVARLNAFRARIAVARKALADVLEKIVRADLL